MKFRLITFVFLALFISCTRKEEVDIVVLNGQIYSVDSSFNIWEAMAIKNGRVVAVGASADIKERFIAKENIDATGKAIYPGFIDAHCHFTGMATDQWKCNLFGTQSFREVLDTITAYAKNANTTWIYGRGWDQNDWESKTYPTKKELDSLFPHQPVFLKRVDGHAALVNQAALNFAGITTSTKTEGGIFETKDGKLTGILIDRAMEMVDEKIPGIPDSLAIEYYDNIQRLCFAVGLTSVQDCGISEHTLGLLERFEKEGRMRIKVFALLSDSVHYYDKWVANGVFRSPLITMGGFKVYADGALGSRGACLLQPYSDQPGWKGFMQRDSAYFSTVANKLADSPFQLCTHAIGDSANRFILNIYGRALTERNNRRWRIEHAQVVNERDFKLFKEFEVIPSVQPTHATSDMYWAGARLGKERIRHAYAYRELLKIHGWMPLGTDFPVEDMSPVKTFYAAVARKDARGFPENGFQKENALTRKEALKGITIWAAKSAFQEGEKGSIEVGKAADFVVMDRDLLTCAEKEILFSKVLMTFINGKKVHPYQ